MKTTYSEVVRRYAVVCIHPDNPNDVQVIEYFSDIDEANVLVSQLNSKKSADGKFCLMQYDLG